MTPIALSYLVLGLSALFWPLAILLFKRFVLGAQWLMATALLLVGLSAIIYSTFFNSFLDGEYLLVMLYMILTLAAAPLTQMSVTALTNPNGVSRAARLLVVPSGIVVALMVLSVLIGGDDMYRLWIDRGSDRLANQFFPGSWRYNLIVAIHYYTYWIAIVLEVLYVIVYTIVSIRRFRRIIGEYYSADMLSHTDMQLAYTAVTANCIGIVVSYILYPFNADRPLWSTILICSVEGIAMFVIGLITWRISYGAERLNEKKHRRVAPRSDISSLAHAVMRYVESDKHFHDPDLSVFLLAEHLSVSEDDIVDAVHHLHGSPFGDYVDSVRVDYATHKLLADPDFHADDPEQMAALAHSCGYLTPDALENAFMRILQQSVDQWYRGGYKVKSEK